jgi:O-Antigen ligase
MADVDVRGGKSISYRRELLWRPIGLPLIPLCVLGAGASTFGRLAATAAVGVPALVAAALLAFGRLPFRRTYLWIGSLAVLLLISFLFPQLRMPATPPSERHHIVELLGALDGLSPAQLNRLSDLTGLVAGLALLAGCVASAPRPRHVARVIAVTGTVAGAFVLVRGGYVGGRLEGLGCNANYLGILLALPIVAAVGLLRSTRRLAWLVPAAVCFVALVDTQSRGAFWTTAAGVGAVVVQGRSRRGRVLLAAAGAAAAGAAVIAGKLPSIEKIAVGLGAGDRSVTGLGIDNGARVRVAELAVRVMIDHPLRGIGYWMFPTYAERSPDFGLYLTTHNEYLRLGAEAGVPALVVFVVLLQGGMWRRRAAADDPIDEPVADLIVVRSVVVAYGVALLFANPLASLAVSAPFWMALGSIWARCHSSNWISAQMRPLWSRPSSCWRSSSPTAAGRKKPRDLAV